MSLLLRRRILEATAARLKEGGGVNDGKYVVIVPGTASTTGGDRRKGRSYRSASEDFGVSFSNPAGAYWDRAGVGVGGIDISSNGALLLSTGSTGVNESYAYRTALRYPANDFAVMAGTQSLVRTSSNVTANFINYPGATCWSEDGMHALIVSRSNASGTASMHALLRIDFETKNSRTGSVTKYGGGGWASTLHETTDLLQCGKSGWRLEANRDDLTHIIISTTQQVQNFGFGGGTASAAAICYDGGSTWTNLENAVLNVSQSTPNRRFGAVAWSNDGTQCLVEYGPEPGQSQIGGPTQSLLYSNNGGLSFTEILGEKQATSFTGSVVKGGSQSIRLAGLAASEKFGTIYLSIAILSGSTGESVIYKSTNRGRTWTHLNNYHQTFGSWPAGTGLMCNAAGDKIIAIPLSSGTAPVYYSHDYGKTWGTSSINAVECTARYARWAMSRDSTNFS